MPALDWLTGSTLSIAAWTAFLATIYRYLPDAEITWTQVLPGALVTALLFEGTRSLIRLYLLNVSADIFGQAASFAVLMIWLYVSASLLFFGAQFTEVWARRLGRPVGPGEKDQGAPEFTMRLEKHLKRLIGAT
jgi:membrane protein